MTRHIAVFFVAIYVLAPTHGDAQRNERITLEGSLGAARSVTGIRFAGTMSLALDAVLSARMPRTPGQAYVVAANVSGFYMMRGSDASCILVTPESCPPPFELGTRSVLLGLEGTSRIGESIRLMVGPTWFRQYGVDSVSGAGFQTRVDIGADMAERLAFLMSGRWLYMPSFHSRALNCFALGFGLRFRVM